MSKVASELSIAEKLKQLYEIQLIDSEIDQISVLKGELPMEVQDLEDEIAGLNTRLQKLADSVDEFDAQVLKYNSKIKEAELLIEKYEKQMDDVKNNREFDALSKELELQKLDIQLFKKKITENMDISKNKRETLKMTEETIADKNTQLAEKKVELEAIIEKTEKSEQKLIKKSTREKKHVDERLLLAYEKVRDNYRNGLAVVNVARNACGGCFNKIPPQIQLEIGLRKKIIVCEHCGRVLVDDYILTVGTPEEFAPREVVEEPVKKKRTSRAKKK